MHTGNTRYRNERMAWWPTLPPGAKLRVHFQNGSFKNRLHACACTRGVVWWYENPCLFIFTLANTLVAPPENGIMSVDITTEFYRLWSALQFVTCVPPLSVNDVSCHELFGDGNYHFSTAYSGTHILILQVSIGQDAQLCTFWVSNAGLRHSISLTTSSMWRNLLVLSLASTSKIQTNPLFFFLQLPPVRRTPLITFSKQLLLCEKSTNMCSLFWIRIPLLT